MQIVVSLGSSETAVTVITVLAQIIKLVNPISYSTNQYQKKSMTQKYKNISSNTDQKIYTINFSLALFSRKISLIVVQMGV